MDVICLEKETIMPFIATQRMKNILLLEGIRNWIIYFAGKFANN
jgi:hypothetical protein